MKLRRSPGPGQISTNRLGSLPELRLVPRGLLRQEASVSVGRVLLPKRRPVGFLHHLRPRFYIRVEKKMSKTSKMSKKNEQNEQNEQKK